MILLVHFDLVLYLVVYGLVISLLRHILDLLTNRVDYGISFWFATIIEGLLKIMKTAQ